MSEIQFLEIEHKYLLTNDFIPDNFIDQVQSLGPTGESIVAVNDTYYVTKGCPGHIFRHRIDHEIQQLTVKSLSDDPDVRTEVNLMLGHQWGDQKDYVDAFLKTLGILWQGIIQKKVWAYYFPQCEVVYYEATFGKRSVKCIEIEAKGAKSIVDAKAKIFEYEKKLQLTSWSRETQSLFQILLLPEIKLSLDSNF